MTKFTLSKKIVEIIKQIENIETTTTTNKRKTYVETEIKNEPTETTKENIKPVGKMRLK